MGIKLLSSFHTLPWCFHFMGTHLSCVHHLPPDDSSSFPLQTLTLISPDGRMKVYDRPVRASELMAEFPKHLICHSDSFFIGQKVPALSEADELKLGQKYFLLPKHFFQSVLTFVTIASFAAASAPSPLPSDSSSSSCKRTFVKKAATSSKPPFDIEKTPSGSLQIRVSDEFIMRMMEERRLREAEEVEEVVAEERDECLKGRVCTTPQLQRDYLQLVGWRRSAQWAPKLETIREKERGRLPAFGMKRRNKFHDDTQKNPSPEIERTKWKSPPPSLPLSPARIRIRW